MSGCHERIDNVRCLPFEAWPQRDQSLWASAVSENDILEELDQGRLAGLAAPSLRKYRKGWGRWLAHLAICDVEALALMPAKRCSKARLQAYVGALQDTGNSHSTIINRLQELSVVTQALDPSFSPSLINRYIAAIRPKVTPVYRKDHVPSAEVLLDLGLSLMAAAHDEAEIYDALAFRDGLIIAFLACHPVRLRNLAAFATGRNLRAQGEGYLLTWAGGETKNGTPYEAVLAPTLIEPMRTYLAVWRPLLAAREGRWNGEIADAVWVSADGSAMSEVGLVGRIKKRTREAFGQSISPHRFRDAAATTLAIAAPAQVRTAAPLLGHRTLATTERYYIQASVLDAQRAFLKTLEEIRHGRQ